MSNLRYSLLVIAMTLLGHCACAHNIFAESLPQSTDFPPGTFVSVRLRGGHVATGIVDIRTNSERLWLRAATPWTVLVSGFRWERITDISTEERVQTFDTPIRMEPVPEPQFLHREQPSPFELQTPWRRLQPPTNRWDGDGSRKVTSLEIDATLANWDRDAATDGLRVRVLPLNGDGLVSPVSGHIDFELTGEILHTSDSQNHWNSRVFPSLERWTVQVHDYEFEDWGAVVELPFDRFHPEADLNIASHALLTARLSVPSIGSFEASTADVTLRPHSSLRDHHQQWTGRRSIRPESRFDR